MSVQTIWSYQENFDFRSDISIHSKFHIALDAHRGDYSRKQMLSAYQLDSEGKLRLGTAALTSMATLFGGHIGSGKSTELRDYANLFQNSYTVSYIETTKILDINNLRFSDLLIALTSELMKTFDANNLSLQPDPIFVKPVLEWFETRITKVEKFKDIEAEIKTEAKAKGGIPFLVELLATMTAKIRGGVSYREELRNEMRNGFTQLLHHFNALISHANDLLQKQNRGPLLFIFDGTDKLSKNEGDTFFNADINQLGQIKTNLIVCAPISVLLEAGALAQRFSILKLPMIKIFERDEQTIKANEDVLIELILKRMPIEHFDSRETIRYLVRHSGGHVRDLIRLVYACFSRIDDSQITGRIAELAIKEVATPYERQIMAGDWQDIVKIDKSLGEEKARTPERLRLLYDLVLLEYNDYWWRSHPLIRTLPAYKKAALNATI